MAVCTFFGHRDCPNNLYVPLRNKIEELILNCNVDLFYVGNNGNFDAMVKEALKELKITYPSIQYYVVLAYMPTKADEYAQGKSCDTLYPFGIENVPKRFTISWRNKWMVKHSDFVIAYVKHSFGGAASFVDYTQKSGRSVIDLA